MTITFDDFVNVDIRLGAVVQCEPYPEARKPSYKLVLDFPGEDGGVYLLGVDPAAPNGGKLF